MATQCNHLCYKIPEKGFFLDGIAHGGPFLDNLCSCKVNRNTSGSIIVDCTGLTLAGASNCPKNSILAEVSAHSGLQISITDGRSSSKSSTYSPDTLAKPITSTATPIHHNATTQSHPLNPQNCNPYPWFIIGCQFVVIVMLVAYLLHQRRRRSALKPPKDNLPLPSNEFTPAIEEVFVPTPRAALQHPPPPAQAVYEVNPNYGEPPSVRRAKVPVYEDHRFDKNDPRTPQHNIYARMQDEQEDLNQSYYSTVKILNA